MGYDATRAKEYYRTNFPNSSLKFRWLNGKATKNPQNWNYETAIPENGRPAKTNLGVLKTNPVGSIYAAPFRQIACFQNTSRRLVNTVWHPTGGTALDSQPQPPAFAVVPDIE